MRRKSTTRFTISDVITPPMKDILDFEQTDLTRCLFSVKVRVVKSKRADHDHDLVSVNRQLRGAAREEVSDTAANVLEKGERRVVRFNRGRSKLIAVKSRIPAH